MRRIALLLCVSLAFGCGDDEFESPEEAPAETNPNAAGAPAAPAAPAPTATAQAEAEKPSKVMPIVEFTESDFVESEESRDPFRNYSYLYARKTRTDRIVQRKVKASPFALDELKLVGIITRGRPSVMLTDPNGYGWLLYTGDFVGKPELISVGGTDGTEVAINWRVDRIRPTDVVFIREDNAHPDIPPTTRVIPLYPAGEDS
jgi:type IV pilus assembly protein PilP